MMQLSLAYLFTFFAVSVSAFPFRGLPEGISSFVRTSSSSHSDGRLHMPNVACRGLECKKPNDVFNFQAKDGACSSHDSNRLVTTSSTVRNGKQIVASGLETPSGLRRQILKVPCIASRPEDIARRDDSPSKDDNEAAKTTESSTAPEPTASSATSSPPSSTPTQSSTVSMTTPAAVTVTVSPSSSSTTIPLSTHLNAGSIAATTIFCVVVIASLSFLLFICLRRRRRHSIAKKQRRESSQTQRLLAGNGAKSARSETDSVGTSDETITWQHDTSSMFVRSSTSSERSSPSLYIPLESVQRPRALSGGLYPLSPESTISSSPISPRAAAVRQSSDLSSRYDPATARRSVSYQGQIGRARVVSIGAARANTLSTLTAGPVPRREPSLVSQLSIDTGVEERYTRGSSVSSLNAQH